MKIFHTKPALRAVYVKKKIIIDVRLAELKTLHLKQKIYIYIYSFLIKYDFKSSKTYVS